MMKYSSLLLALSLTNQSAFAAGFETLTAHRAVYDVSLLKAEERSGIEQMNGRIAYEVRGDACEGLSVSFRFVAKIVTSSDSFVTDQRTITHESPDGRELTFNTNSFVNNVQDQKITGNASRSDEGVLVSLGRDEERQIELENAIFTSTQLVDVIEAAKNGTRFIKHDIFDGSGAADKVLDSVSVIGAPKLYEDVLEGEDEAFVKPLLSKPAWPVTMSYFEKTQSHSAEAVPIYEASFYLYENGISRQLKMRYPDYVLSANLTNLEYFEQAACKISD